MNGHRWMSVRNFWLGAFAVSLLLSFFARDWFPRWALKYPSRWKWSLSKDISQFMDWLVEEASLGFFTVKEATRALAWLLELPLNFATSALATGFVSGYGESAQQWLPSLSWIAVIVLVGMIGWRAQGARTAALGVACFGYLAIFGQWQSAMVTLSSILISVPFGVLGGLLLGIAAYRWAWVARVLQPVLDLMQTIPIFAYLVPILFLFGFGPVSAMVGTIIYAMPPMVRVTLLALQSVPEGLLESGRMSGCTPRQLLWKVLVPSAKPQLMVGVNQVIMLSLNMVIIASMIGAGGLGYDVLTALRRLDIGGGLEAGIGIVVLAIALDRISQAFAEPKPRVHQRVSTQRVNNRFELKPWQWALLAVLLSGLLGALWPAVQSFPEAWQLTTGPVFENAVRWMNVHWFETLEAIKNALLLNVLIPVKRFLLSLPWAWVIALLVVAAWQLGRWRLALLALLLSTFILITGQWQKAMITVYLCGISVLIAALIGIPLGVVAARSERAWKILQAAIDTLQTLPSFVYLIPVVMLFRVGDFSAMVAIVLYAIAPAIRYTAHGIRNVPEHLIEAGIVSGCTKRQLLWKIRLPMATPEILLGINQTLMLALSMLVITALVGTRDLGQEVYIALTKADTGRGLVAGLSVAFIAIIADRMIAAAAERSKKRLGIGQ